MTRTNSVLALAVATLAASLAVASSSDLGPVSVEAAEAAVAWHCANDPEYLERHEGLEAQLQAARARRAYRLELTRRVVASELSFADVAAEFLLLNRDAGVLPMLRWRFPGLSDEELAYWNVIEYVRNSKFLVTEKAGTLARLEGEFQARFGRPPRGSF
jgi:hypothetical protein